MGEAAPSKCCRTTDGMVVSAETQWIDEPIKKGEVNEAPVQSEAESVPDPFSEAANETPAAEQVRYTSTGSSEREVGSLIGSATRIEEPVASPAPPLPADLQRAQRKKKGLPTGKFAQRAMSRSSTYELDGTEQNVENEEEEQQTADSLIDNLVVETLMKADRGSGAGAILSGSKGSMGGRLSLVFTAPDENDRAEEKKMLIKSLFRTDESEHLVKDVEARHDTMRRILPQLFVKEDVRPHVAAIPTLLTRRDSGTNFHCDCGCRHVASRLVKTKAFTSFFMLLTFYAIFGPDLVLLLADKSADFAFQVFNTVVFFLFGIELVLQCLGRPGYILTLTALLDLVSVLSILSDTYLLKAMHVDQDGARVSRMARSSRMTRLARIIRVARVTRLLPRLLSMCGKQRETLGKRLLEKRLWRSFLMMAKQTHGKADDKISCLDLKCFYLGVLADGQYMLNEYETEDLLTRDLAILCDRTGDEMVTFIEFRDIILSTCMGKQLLKYHMANVEREDGVWMLTQKLSDNTALKVCCGLLVLIGVMALCEIRQADAGAEQGLIQLDAIVRSQKVGGALSSSAGSFLCDQIAIYARRYTVLYVYLDGATYFDRGVCTATGTKASVLDPFKHADHIIDSSPLRRAEVLQSCWPDNEDCSRSGTTSMSLVDSQENNAETIRGSLYMTSIVIALLLIFVYVLNLGITNFSKTLLQPLHALVDDMAAMSMLELVNIDREMPASTKGTKAVKVADELLQLQKACESMRGAIKSWSKFVPPAVVQRLFSAGVEAKIGVARTPVTILFCDIAGFEDACRGLSPEEVLDVLSQVLGRIADVITNQRGTLLEFIGCEVVAVFNTPNSIRHHVYAGVEAALIIHDLVAKLQIKDNKGETIPIACRCGVNTAQVLAGNIGSSQRMKYGLLGDGVNLTARLKSITSKYQLRTLASDKVIADERVSTKIVCRPIDFIAVKGKKEPTAVFEPIEIGNEEESGMLTAAMKHDEAFELYRQRKFVEAQALFEEVNQLFLKQDKKDKPSEILRDRCKAYIETPPPDDWDGVERLTKK